MAISVEGLKLALRSYEWLAVSDSDSDKTELTVSTGADKTTILANKSMDRTFLNQPSYSAENANPCAAKRYNDSDVIVDITSTGNARYVLAEATTMNDALPADSSGGKWLFEFDYGSNIAVVSGGYLTIKGGSAATYIEFTSAW